jgi:hypothetical protein
MEVTRLAMKPLILDKEPNLALEHMINLLGRMGMRCGVITGRPYCVHQATFAAVGALYDHRSFALFTAANHLAVRDIFGLTMERHAVTPRM